MEAGKRSSQSLVVTRKTAESRSPREAVLYHPAARQQYEAALGLGVLDYVQLDILRLRSLCCIFSRVALVYTYANVTR